MKIDYDKDKDSAYVLLGGSRAKAVYTTHANCTLPEPWHRVDTPITLRMDWDEDGRLIGFEADPASKILSPDALKKGQ